MVEAKKTRSKKRTRKKSRKKHAVVKEDPRKETLEGLRDALDLTLTRVIEDDVGVEEARSMLRYFKKELDGLEQQGGADISLEDKNRRRTSTTRKPKRTGDR